MVRKTAVLILILMLAAGVVSCTRDDKGAINMDGLRKFVQDSKEKGKMDYDKTKKAYKSVMPNIDMK